MEKNKRSGDPEILDHNYDGIQEFDNPLPSWWLLTFYGTIIFAVLYVGYYHFGSGPSLDDELASDLHEVKLRMEAQRQAEPPPSDEELNALFAKPEVREHGKKLFGEKCAACHGGAGEGGIGPNLTDKFWLHGQGRLADLIKIVADGVPEKGMPPWKSLLSREQVMAAAAHVHGLAGTKPANPKAPQGEKIKE